MYIYPSTIKREVNINKETVYQILNILEKEGILKSYFELSCQQCGKTIKLVEKLGDILEEEYCEDCEKDIDILSSTKIIYKVIK